MHMFQQSAWHHSWAKSNVFRYDPVMFIAAPLAISRRIVWFSAVGANWRYAQIGACFGFRIRSNK